MNEEDNKSLVEIALELMKSKRKARTLEKITDEVFQKKKYEKNSHQKEAAQFALDFMLCGYFVVATEDKNGDKLWDLKSRVQSSILDKESTRFIEDPYDDDEDVIKNELTDDTDYTDEDKPYDEIEEDEEEDDELEPDDIEEELALYDDDGNVTPFDEESDEDEEEDDDYGDGNN